MSERKIIVQRKQIKNMYTRLSEKGDILITCSPAVSEARIRKFIAEKQAWIEKTEQKMSHRKNREMKMTGSSSDCAILLGKEYRVIKKTGEIDEIIQHGEVLEYTLTSFEMEHIDEVFYQYVGKMMVTFLQEDRKMLDHVICEEHHVRYPSIAIRYMKTRWGSCTPKTSRIRMNVRLMHYPRECIQAVLLHEYAHLLVPNHSRQFYALVESIMPAYHEYDKMLR